MDIVEGNLNQQYQGFVGQMSKGFLHPLDFQGGALGLNGEAGEVADVIKKYIYHDGGKMTPEQFKERVVEELGDTLFYLTWLAMESHITLDGVMAYNMEKLKARYPERAL